MFLQPHNFVKNINEDFPKFKKKAFEIGRSIRRGGQKVYEWARNHKTLVGLGLTGAYTIGKKFLPPHIQAGLGVGERIIKGAMTGKIGKTIGQEIVHHFRNKYGGRVQEPLNRKKPGTYRPGPIHKLIRTTQMPKELEKKNIAKNILEIQKNPFGYFKRH